VKNVLLLVLHFFPLVFELLLLRRIVIFDLILLNEVLMHVSLLGILLGGHRRCGNIDVHINRVIVLVVEATQVQVIVGKRPIV
jgi:hypothetical protein